jgi:Autophagy protein Atg8 ubiquitin like
MRKPSRVAALYSSDYKIAKPFDHRFLEHKALRHTYPNDVPFIVITVDRKTGLATQKFLYSKETLVTDLLASLKQEGGGEFIVETHGKPFVVGNAHKTTVGEFYGQHRDSDGFVYLVHVRGKKMT